MVRTERELAREAFLTGRQAGATAPVDPVVHASWQRSRQLQIDIDRPRPAYADRYPEPPLARIARPVLQELTEELVNEPIAIVLTDAHGLVLDRLGGDADLHRRLDRAFLAPGFNYAESEVGTNGIGTALEVGGATLIHGAEHYAGSLVAFACGATPIRHPISGQLLGVLDITALAEVANPLLKAVSQLTAARIQQGVLESMNLKQRALLDDYYATCRHGGGPVIALGDDLTMINEVAQQQFSGEDQSALLAQIREALGSARSVSYLAELPSGVGARLSYRPTFAADQLVGGVFRIQQLQRAIGDGPPAAATPIRLSAAAGSSPMWQRLLRSLLSSARARQWLALEGEAGTGKRALVRAAHSHLNRGDHLSELDAAGADVDGFLAELEQALASGDSLLVQHLESFPEGRVPELTAVLQRVSELSPLEPGWLVVTVTNGEAASAPLLPAELLGYFPRSLRVPPLRHHVQDIPELMPKLLASLGAREVTIAPDATRQLMRMDWPGNIAQLRSVLATVARKRRSGTVSAADLPPLCRSTTRRLLSALEALERDAIVDALSMHGNDRTAAAGALGISRATIYRKIRDYGITG